MAKTKVENILIRQNIYQEKRCRGCDHLLSLYTYDNGDEFLSTISEDEDYYITSQLLPQTGVGRNRRSENFEQTEADLNFEDSRWEQKSLSVIFKEARQIRIIAGPCGW